MDDILIDKVSGVVVLTVQLVLGVGGSGPKIERAGGWVGTMIGVKQRVATCPSE